MAAGHGWVRIPQQQVLCCVANKSGPKTSDRIRCIQCSLTQSEGVKACLSDLIPHNSYCRTNFWKSSCWLWFKAHTVQHSLSRMWLHTCSKWKSVSDYFVSHTVNSEQWKLFLDHGCPCRPFSVHADPCPPLAPPTVGTWAELDYIAM